MLKKFPTYDQAEVIISLAIKAATQGENGLATRLVQTETIGICTQPSSRS